MEMQQKTHILIIDDDDTIQKLLAKKLEPYGYIARGAPSGREGVEAMKDGQVDLILLDYLLPDMNGMTALERIHAWNPDLPVLIFTAHANVRLAVETMRLGGVDLIEKPVTDFQLLDYQIRLSIERARRRIAEKKNETEWLNRHILGAIASELRTPVEAIRNEYLNMQRTDLNEEQKVVLYRLFHQIEVLMEVISLIEVQGKIPEGI